jgi:ABC-type multidrug transport system fused ATPase/permease subunit
MENIRYGRLEASDAEVKEAARQAHAHDFIAQIPESNTNPWSANAA